MKKCIKKLLFSSFVTFISIGINFDIEARVTKEVAEATLPYLMEAAGIPGDEEDKAHEGREKTTIKAHTLWYSKSKINAILSMIYTDDGQGQMVNWVKNGIFPKNLIDAGFVTSSTYMDTKYRQYTIGALFPIITHTFCSFSNNDLRLGKHWLTQKENIKYMLPEFIINNTVFNIRERNNFEGILQNINQFRIPVDILLSKIIFVLDICDNPVTISNIFKLRSVLNPIKASYFEYTCRPVSATIALDDDRKHDGDCVETLYRHLINIAIQDKADLSKFHTEKLPSEIYKYYYDNVGEKHSKVIAKLSEAGTTDIELHNKWRECLRKQLPTQNISLGSLTNISKVLSQISETEYREDDLRQTIIDSLVKFQEDHDTTFNVTINGKSTTSPEWVVNEITITQDTSIFIRKVIIGVASEERGHAEILGITFIKK